jgi:hypothetical protein
LPFGVAYLLDGAMHNDSQNNANLPLPFPMRCRNSASPTTGTDRAERHALGSIRQCRSPSPARTGSRETCLSSISDHRFNRHRPVREGRKRQEGSTTACRATSGAELRAVRSSVTSCSSLAGYQGTNQHQIPASNIAFVPTEAMLRGDFRDFASAECNGGTAVTLRAPYVNNQVNPSQFSPAALKLVSYLPKADDQKCGQVTYGQPATASRGRASAVSIIR